MVGQFTQQALCFRPCIPVGQGGGGGGSVRFGEDHVENDRGGTEVSQLLHQTGQYRAWPGPLADFCQAVIIDINNANRYVQCGSGFPLLKAVEHKIAHGRQGGKVGLHGKGQCKYQHS